MAVEQAVVLAGEPVDVAHMDTHQLGVAASGHAGGPADQPITAERAGQRDDDPLAGLPRLGDPMTLPVLLEAFVDPIGDPQQRQLSERREVADAEVVGQGGVDLVSPIDVAVGHAPAQGLRGHVDDLDLVGGPHDGVGHGLALDDAGDALDDVVEGLEVLDVDRGDDHDPGAEELLDVLPALLVAAPRHVRVGQLVHQRGLRPSGEHRIEVHLLEVLTSVGEGVAWHHLQVADLGGCGGAPVGLDVGDDHVGAALLATPALVEHGERLADPGGRTHVDAQLASVHADQLVIAGRGRRSARAR